MVAFIQERAGYHYFISVFILLTWFATAGMAKILPLKEVGFQGVEVFGLALSPNGTVYAASARGLYQSLANEKNWIRVEHPEIRNATAVEVSSKGTLWVADSSNGVYRLKNGQWTHVFHGNYRSIPIHFIKARSEEEILIVVWDRTRQLGDSDVFLSHDGGDTWNRIAGIDYVYSSVVMGDEGVVVNAHNRSFKIPAAVEKGFSSVPLPFPNAVSTATIYRGKIISLTEQGVFERLVDVSDAAWRKIVPIGGEGNLFHDNGGRLFVVESYFDVPSAYIYPRYDEVMQTSRIKQIHSFLLDRSGRTLVATNNGIFQIQPLAKLNFKISGEGAIEVVSGKSHFLRRFDSFRWMEKEMKLCLKAIPDKGYHFTGWEKDGVRIFNVESSDELCFVLMKDVSVEARFETERK